MTEDEAKQRWCPFARAKHGNRMPYGSGGDGPADKEYCEDTAMEFPCIASDCMAWSWIVTPEKAKTFFPGKHKGKGRCGLAGKE